MSYVGVLLFYGVLRSYAAVCIRRSYAPRRLLALLLLLLPLTLCLSQAENVYQPQTLPTSAAAGVRFPRGDGASSCRRKDSAGGRGGRVGGAEGPPRERGRQMGGAGDALVGMRSKFPAAAVGGGGVKPAGAAATVAAMAMPPPSPSPSAPPPSSSMTQFGLTSEMMW